MTLTEQIILTREEVREARAEFRKWDGVGHKSCFLDMKMSCGITDAACCLCKVLTQFATQEEGGGDE